MFYMARQMYRINQSHSLPHNTKRSIFTLATHRLSKSHCSPALHAAESTNSPVNQKNICSMASSFVNSKKTKTLKTT